MKEERMVTIEEADRALKAQKEYYENKLKEKPNAIQIISLATSCFALGLSMSGLINAVM